MSARADPRIQDRISGPAVATGVLAAACGAALALATRNLGQGPVVAIFMLAVTVAAVTGGIWAGIFAALLSALAVRFIHFPGEEGGFAFEQLRDVVAAVVFL